MQVADLFQTSLNEAIEVISPQQAIDQKFFGPMYHGTRGDLSAIIASGFDVQRSIPSGVDHWNNPVGASNGYSLEGYGYTGIAAPVHHLGFGVYMTTQKATAVRFAGGTAKGQRAFYLASQNVHEINFGAPNTMMRWWRQHGYDMTAEATKQRDLRTWIAATQKLTDTLSAHYDAVWFLGKGIRRLLDGDQVCIYRPDLLRVVDPKRATGLEVGATIMATHVIPNRFRGSNIFYVDDLKPGDFGSAGRMANAGWRGIFRADQEPHPTVGRYPVHFIPPKGMKGVLTKMQTGRGMYSVKWAKGGEMYNYEAEELEPVGAGGAR